MARELNMQESRIKRIFPCLDELITLHCSFLWRLRQRQRGTKYIETIGDLLVDQFTGDNARGLRDAYGQFCSQHQDAVSSPFISTLNQLFDKQFCHAYRILSFDLIFKTIYLSFSFHVYLEIINSFINFHLFFLGERLLYFFSVVVHVFVYL